MNLTKYLKGTITITELENMPNRFIHTIYKEYSEMIRDSQQQENMQAEQEAELLEEAMGG